MMKKVGFFDYEGELHRICTKVMYIVTANLLFLLFSIPVVTIGASRVAMHTLLLKCSQGEEVPLFRTFFHVFRENLKKATLLWGIMLLALTSVGINVFFSGWMDSTFTGVLHGFCAVILIVLLILWIYLFPVMAYYENTITGYLKYSMALAIAHLPQTAFMIFIQVLTVVVILLSLQFLPFAVMLVLLCGFSLPAYVSCKTVYKLFCYPELTKIG
ncbi:MAG: DUF624 domain-containing protein [Clostridiales bacterium]|nr:DUF624 domain-containing protein [Clostridiales bacterium]